MLILNSDVIANYVEQCETFAYKEDIKKDGVMRQFKKQKTNHEKTKIHNRYFDYYLFAD